MFVVDIDFITTDVEGEVVDSIVDVFKVKVDDSLVIVVEFDPLDDPDGNVFDDLFVETDVVIFEDGASFDVVSFIFDISVVASVDVS